MGELVANLTMAAAILLLGVSLALAVLGFVAAARVRHRRLAFVATAFLLFAAKGAYLSLLAYRERAAVAAEGWSGLLATVVLVDLVIVIVLYMAAWTK